MTYIAHAYKTIKWRPIFNGRQRGGGATVWARDYRGGWPRLTFGHQGRLMNGSHVRNRGAQIEGSGIFSLAV